MSTALATLAGKLAERVGMDSVDPQELITTLRQTAFKGDASDAQFIALLIVANQYGLNPWTKEIYAFPDKQNGIVPVVGVDGWSRIINENQQFDGMDFEQDNESCTCRIYRKDRNHPICVTEWMDECRREPFKTREGREITGPWQSHPKRMLRHKAMIQCARLAFGFAGIYDKDEAERIVENTAYTAERQPERDITPVKRADGTSTPAVRKMRIDSKTSWLSACRRAGIEDFRFHDLRHTWASWLIQSGVPLSVLQEMGGWESIEMVRRYAHLAPNHLTEHARKIDDIFGDNVPNMSHSGIMEDIKKA
ncbi:phage recombination protein Bet [Escherichia coli]|nr:phage recombination protein Bet [Escherichia coli]EEZ6010330.1 phage recombination protein Bet [Escherichia coli O117]KAE9905313.1 phage recombination protein Bet [Enterobacteriaceae bacterium TzEc051]EEV7162034.1 phage recombination protein Bet [Escherichia coli]EEX2905422.1 phage recombination protein Bet [Escherichia coli]